MIRFPRKLRLLAMTCALPALMLSPALADPTVGVGVSIAFGGGKTSSGIGLRVFSDDRRDRAVGSLGLDYMFGTQSWRGTVGAAYLGRNAYVGLDLGFGLNDGSFNFGPSLGVVNTRRPPAAPVAPPVGDGGGDYD